MSPQRTGIATSARRNAADFDPLAALDGLRSDAGLCRARTGGTVAFAGQDPILPAAHRLRACLGIALMANAVAAVAFHRHQGGSRQDLEPDLRQANHGFSLDFYPGAAICPRPLLPSPSATGSRPPRPY